MTASQTQAGRWLDGFVTTAWLLGLRGEELRAALGDMSPPAWLESLEALTLREDRARAIAPRVAALTVAVEQTRPRWR